MVSTRVAKWSLVIAGVIGIVVDGSVFAAGGLMGASGIDNAAFGLRSHSVNPLPGVPLNDFGPIPRLATGRYTNSASPLNAVGEIVLYSPADTSREAKYLLNGAPNVMQPGATQRLMNDRVWTVEVNSETGRVMRYTLSPGSYKFKETGLGKSMGLFATQDRPNSATAPNDPLPPQSISRMTIAAAPMPMFDRADSWPVHQEMRRRLSGGSAPAATPIRGSSAPNAVSPDQFRGNVVLLDFWASWCGPCVRNLPKVQALHEKYRDRGLVVIGIHAAQGAESAGSFLANRPVSFPIAIDTGATAQRYGVDGFPTYVLIDKTGQKTWNLGHELPTEWQIENLLKQ